ncbi:ABC-2 type transport system permease protein [Georgenia satyanarayanai]|uniref:ABC-2 type transport system permease protein n=1 Tax=Georgenia satyanarayanai TaxID=860221 RepID=A0A2Y9C6P2_9MICO|nr:ABC transporter permease [Georgenia satyanarayanai]PYF99245.1 ABC-2 type transport system permease protein [Georgenia satyanarayanai]SSA43363.1 ABC-2 type transport system permease protein [Georgenia satyanarayanai]
MLTIARSELIQLFRDRTALFTSLIMPLAASIFFIYNRDLFADAGGSGYIAVLLIFTLAGFSLYATVVTTLAARRQNLFLKRLRSTAATDSAIVSGLVLPITVISLVQVGLVLVAFAVVSDVPANIALLVVASAASFAMMLGLGMATAGVTSSSERAQITTLPVSLGIVAVAIWVGVTGAEELALLKRLLPGGAATELVVHAWNGGYPLSDSLLLLAPTLAWVWVAVALATRFFRWEPRR